MDDGTTLATLMADREAAATLHRYQRLVDAKDMVGLASLITDDVILERQDGQRRGREPFLDLYRQFAASDVEVAQHMATNIEVTGLESGQFRVDSCFVAITTHTRGEARVIWGRYRDDLVPAEGGWLFSAKRIRVVRTAFIEASSMAPLSMDSFGPRPN